MNTTSNFSLVEFYHLPGLGTKESATIITTGTEDDCHTLHAHLRKANLCTGDSSSYRYSILPTEDADHVLHETNAEYARDLAEFRLKVYGEPLPAEHYRHEALGDEQEQHNKLDTIWSKINI